MSNHFSAAMLKFPGDDPRLDSPRSAAGSRRTRRDDAPRLLHARDRGVDRAPAGDVQEDDRTCDGASRLIPSGGVLPVLRHATAGRDDRRAGVAGARRPASSYRLRASSTSSMCSSAQSASAISSSVADQPSAVSVYSTRTGTSA